MLGDGGRPGPQLAECPLEGPSGAGAHAQAVLFVSTFLSDVASFSRRQLRARKKLWVCRDVFAYCQEKRVEDAEPRDLKDSSLLSYSYGMYVCMYVCIYVCM